MTNSGVDEEQRRISPRQGNGYPSDLGDVKWTQLAPLIPPALPRRATAQDRHAGGDECLSIFAADRLPLALCAARQPSAALDRLQYFSQVPADGVWKAIWAELHMALREQMGREAAPRRRLATVPLPRDDLIRAEGVYSAWQVDAAVAKVSPLRPEIVKRRDDKKGCVVLPRAGWSTHLLLVRPRSASRQGLREPRRNLGHLR